MPAKISETRTTTKPQMRDSNSSAVRRGSGLWFKFSLQDWGYKIFGASLCELTTRLLALSIVKVVRVLASVPIPVFTSSHQDECYKCSEQ